MILLVINTESAENSYKEEACPTFVIADSHSWPQARSSSKERLALSVIRRQCHRLLTHRSLRQMRSLSRRLVSDEHVPWC